LDTVSLPDVFAFLWAFASLRLCVMIHFLALRPPAVFRKWSKSNRKNIAADVRRLHLNLARCSCEKWSLLTSAATPPATRAFIALRACNEKTDSLVLVLLPDLVHGPNARCSNVETFRISDSIDFKFEWDRALRK
jgi:hypothetical protein